MFSFLLPKTFQTVGWHTFCFHPIILLFLLSFYLLMQILLIALFLNLFAPTAMVFNYAGTSPNKANNKVVGAAAYDLLLAAKPSLHIEIQYMGSARLSPATLTQFITFIQDHLHKPGGILISEKTIEAGRQDTLSTQQVALIEKKNRTAYNTSRQVALYILVADAGAPAARRVRREARRRERLRRRHVRVLHRLQAEAVIDVVALHGREHAALDGRACAGAHGVEARLLLLAGGLRAVALRRAERAERGR